MPVKFCSIASGSNGNSIYIGTESTNILIDAGMSGIKIEKGLKEINVDPSNIDAIFITHEHSDHILSAGILSRRHNIPIFASSKTWDVMEKFNKLGKIKDCNKRYVYKEEKCILNDICIRPFEIPHDAVEPMGYSIFAENYKISIATDIGHVTDIIKEHIYDSDVLLIESNHDIEMLQNGSYPYKLKQRVLSDFGHLSNNTTGNLLTEIMSSRLKHIYLGHLSGENNKPKLALDTVTNILEENNISIHKMFKLSIACRGAVSEPLCLA